MPPITMGLYGLRPSSVGVLERVSTPVVERFRAHAARGAPTFRSAWDAKETVHA